MFKLAYRANKNGEVFLSICHFPVKAFGPNYNQPTKKYGVLEIVTGFMKISVSADGTGYGFFIAAHWHFLENA